MACVACQRDTANGTRSLWFSGYLNTVRIHGGVLSDDQIANNFLNGPSVPVALTPPNISGIPAMTNGQFRLLINGSAGADFYIEASTNLVQWQTLFTNSNAATPFYWTDTDTADFPARFYRVRISE